MQEQHYQQYMAQVYAQQAKTAGASPDGQISMDSARFEQPNLAENFTLKEAKINDESEVSDEEPGDDLPCK